MKALIVGSIDYSIGAAQYEPFEQNRKTLQQDLNLTFEAIKAPTFFDIGEACKQYQSDIIFFLPYNQERYDPESSQLAEKIIRDVRESYPNRKLIFLDPFAQTSTRFFNVLPYVDWFVKRQRFKDVSQYQQHFLGGSMMTDFIANQMGIDLKGWSVDSKVPAGHEHRITTGWNLGTAKIFENELNKPNWLPFNRKSKDIDVFCRLSLGPEQMQEWYCQYRLATLEALKPLESNYKVVASGGFSENGLVPRRQYFNELKRSRIVFSPFGWGEGCWRDFEAVCYDALLIKPSMEHIDTQPNIYIDGETYVAVRWDLQDLVEKCQFYLNNPEAANQIIQNARRVYKSYFEQKQFVKTLEKLIL